MEQTKEIDVEDLILENEYDDGLFINDEDISANTTEANTSEKSTQSTKESNYEDELDFDSDYIDYHTTINPDENENESEDYYDKEEQEVPIIEQTNWKDDQLEVYFKINDRILNDENIIRTKHDDLEISCFLIGNEKIVHQGLFKKIDEYDNIISIYDESSQNMTLRSSKKITLNLHNLSINDRGKYECGVEEYSEKSKYFNLLVTGKYICIFSLKLFNNIIHLNCK